MPRRLGALLLLGLAVVLAACDDDGGSDERGEAEWVEVRLRPPPYYEEQDGGGYPRHELVCPGGATECPDPAAVAALTWQDGESSITVFTANGRPTAEVPRPVFERYDDGNARRVKVRGHPGVLWFADAGDFELVWRERPGVWVRMTAEDFGHSTREIQSLADDLQVGRWSGPPQPDA